MRVGGFVSHCAAADETAFWPHAGGDFVGKVQLEGICALGAGVTDTINNIDYNAMFNAAYTQQCRIVHVMSDTVTAFLGLDDEKQFTILSEAIDPKERQAVHFTAVATMFGSLVLESLRVGTPGLAELDGLSDTLGLPLNIRD